MNLRNFDFNSTKFIYKLESNDKFKNNWEKVLQNLDQGKMSAEFAQNTSGEVGSLLDGGNKIEDSTEKSRDFLTSLGKNQLIDEMAQESGFFAENADPKRVEEFFQKHLQRNNQERLSDEEWKGVMGNLSSEIGEIYRQANQEFSRNKFSPEMVNKSLEGVFKNGQELEKVIYQKGLRSPDEIMDFIHQNTANLPKEIQEAFDSNNPELEDFIKGEAILNLAAKFERRASLPERKKAQAEELISGLSGRMIGENGWENFNDKDITKEWIKIFGKELNLKGMPGYVATSLKMKLIKDENLKESLHNAKNEIFQAQLKGKSEKADKLISGVLSENSAKNLSKEDLNKQFEKKLGDLNLFDNLPEKSEFRKDLYEKIKKSWEEQSEKFLSSEKLEDVEEADKISRGKMKESWTSWVSHLKDYGQDFKNSRDFQKAFISKYFSNNSKDAEAYFEKHPNYAKSFEKSFQHYESGQESFFNAKIDKVAGKLSDLRVSSALKNSFKKARNNGEKRGWLKYLDSHIGSYEKSIQNSAKIESRLATGFSSLKNHPKIGKVRDNFLLMQKSRKFLNGKGQYISPRNYEENLEKIESKFSVLEKKDKVDRKKAEKDIASLNPAKFSNLKNINSKEDLAKKSGIKMPEYLWKEFGQEQFWNKMDKVYADFTESKEGSLEKSPSVKFAKETIKSLSHEDLDFSRDFATQQSFNRQRQLRNQVSFAPEVWEAVKSDFHKKSESLYSQHQKLRGEINTLSRGIKNLKAGDLDFSKNYKNLAEFSHQPEFFEFFKNQKVSNLAYDQIKNSEFTPKILELYGDYLKQKNGVDNSPETAKSREIIDNLQISDLNISQDFTSFSEFKRQSYLQKTVSFDADIWEKIQPNFEQKALQLYSEHIQIREEQKKFEKALNSLTTEDVETDFESFSEFVHQPAMREFFNEINISDMAYDALTDNFAGKMNELWESVKGNENADEFGEKDIQKLGTKHGLNFFNLPLDNKENLEMKFGRLDKLLTRNSSLANFFRKQEEHLAPVFLGFLGEMNNDDFKRLEEDLGTSEKSSEEIVNIFFNSPRRQYLLSEVRKNDADAWHRLGIGERSFNGDLDIRGFLGNKNEEDSENDEFAEFELDENGNPILETDDEVDENLDSDENVSEEDESGELLEENIDDVVELDDEEIEEENEAESRHRLAGRGEILEEGLESEDEDEKLDSVENIAESDEAGDMVDEEISRDSEEKLAEDLDYDETQDELSAESSEDDNERKIEESEEVVDEGIEAIEADSKEEDESEEDLQKLEGGEKDGNKVGNSDDNILIIDADKEKDEEEEKDEISRYSAEEKIPPAPFLKGEQNIEQGKDVGKDDLEEVEKKEAQEKVEEEEKLNALEQEKESREKILENIQRKELEESVEEKQERINDEQEALRRILRQDEFFQKLEKEGAEEIAEDGDENSLSGKVRDDLLQRKSPVNFAEMHCSGVMTLGALLGKVHSYLELIAGKDINFQMNLSEKESLRETEKSREIFLEIIEFLMQKEIYTLQKVALRPQNFAGNSGALRINANYVSDYVSKKIEISLKERL